MGYHIGNGIWEGVFAVPNQVADQHLKLASGLAVKVLLLLLRRGGDVAPREMAELLGHALEDIQDAVNYWISHGVLAETAGELLAATPPPAQRPVLQYEQVPPAEAIPAPAPPQVPELSGDRKVAILSNSRQKLTTQEINEMAEQDENIGYLLQETQAVLGKTLTPVATDTVAALYSYYGMQPDMILMLIHYCVSIGKDSMRYIETVAADWLKKGVDSHEKAETEILRLTQKDQMENKVKTAFGIYDRTLITKEKEYIQTWIRSYKMDLAVIQLAFERTVETKGKLSFPYINGILTNWHGKGITTTALAMQEIRDNKDSKTSKGADQGKGSSYDIGELEDMISYGDLL